METCQFKIAPEMARQIDIIARHRDVTVGQILREMIAGEIDRYRRAAVQPATDDEPFTQLRGYVARDFGAAPNWPDLQTRLKEKGVELRVAGGGLAQHRFPTGQRVCKASDLGFGYAALAERMGRPFPGLAATEPGADDMKKAEVPAFPRLRNSL